MISLDTNLVICGSYLIKYTSICVMFLASAVQVSFLGKLGLSTYLIRSAISPNIHTPAFYLLSPYVDSSFLLTQLIINISLWCWWCLSLQLSSIPIFYLFCDVWQSIRNQFRKVISLSFTEDVKLRKLLGYYFQLMKFTDLYSKAWVIKKMKMRCLS